MPITRSKLTCRCGAEFRRFSWRLPTGVHTCRTVCPRCEPSTIETCEMLEAAYGYQQERNSVRGGFERSSQRMVYTWLWLAGLCFLAVVAIEIARELGFFWS